MVKANEAFEDVSTAQAKAPADEDSKEETAVILRRPGEKWMIHGPLEYVPPVQASVIRQVEAIALDENEGVYVSRKTGEIKAVIGETLMLSEDEEKWEKPLSFAEELLAPKGTFDDEKSASEGGIAPKWCHTKCQVPHNSAVQVYDYREQSLQRPRVVFGPALVILCRVESRRKQTKSGRSTCFWDPISALT